MVWRLAWRNLRRNPRRTAIVVTAVAVGLAGCMVSMAVNYGMVVQMVDAAIATELGHVQVHAPGFERDPELSVLLRDGGREALEQLAGLAPVSAAATRVRAQGLVNSPRASAGVQIVGVDPERERGVSRIAETLVDGAWLDGANRVLIGRDLARRLQVGVGDKIVLSVSDLAGDLTGQAFRVGGLFDAASLELNGSAVFVPIETAQALLGLGQAVTEVVAIVAAERYVEEVSDALRTAFGERAEVRTWWELRPVLKYMLESFESMAWFLYAAIFVAMAFGIANVLLMAVYERTHEIGMLMAVGMRRRRIVACVMLESLFLTGLGLLAGAALAAFGTWSLRDGIDLSAWSSGLSSLGVGSRIVPVMRVADLGVPLVVATVSALVASLWPALRAVALVPADALRRI